MKSVKKKIINRFKSKTKRSNDRLYENAAPQTDVLKYGWKSLWKITP